MIPSLLISTIRLFCLNVLGLAPLGAGEFLAVLLVGANSHIVLGFGLELFNGVRRS